MPTGWSCPKCGLVLAPHVNEHRCDPPSGGVPAMPKAQPPSPWPSSITVTSPPSITVTPGTTYSGTVWGTGRHGGGFQSFPGDSVTVTTANACDVYGSCGHASCAVSAPRYLRLVTGPAA